MDSSQLVQSCLSTVTSSAMSTPLCPPAHLSQLPLMAVQGLWSGLFPGSVSPSREASVLSVWFYPLLLVRDSHDQEDCF